jgi:hypothetical protein
MTTVVIMPGGFHPYHAGHHALYQSAQRTFPDAEVYVAATNDTSSRPFPFAVKEKLAKLAGVEPGHFVQVKSPFRAEEITAKFDPEKDVLIFVRSEKDANTPPRPGGVKKDGSPSYLQPLLGAKKLEPFARHAYMAYLPTVEFGPGMTSATQIRAAWPTLNDRRKTALVMSLYPRTQTNPKLAATVVKLLDAAIGGQDLAEGNNDGPQTVTRIDSQQIKDFGSNLKNYKHTDDWAQSGIDTGDDSYWQKKNLKTNTTKGLFAGDPQRTALYATGNAHETRYVEFTQNGQPIVYFDKKDLPKMRGRKTYLTVFDAANFRKLPTGEWFSENPGKPIKQTPISDPFQYIADQGWVVRVTDDLNKVFKQVQSMHKTGKIQQYGAEGMNESLEQQGVAKSSLNEFAPGSGNDDDSEDPYKYPKPKSYARSADYFGQFEAGHFDREDFDDATGEFKGYWGKTQIAYFKFDNPAKTGSNDPGMGWYYEPESMADDGDTAAKPAAFDNAEQRKQQELGMIDTFLKSGRAPTPGSQIYGLMKRHGLVEVQNNDYLDE